MRVLHIHTFVYIIAGIVLGACGQNEICSFYGLEASCRYHIDAFSLSHIRAEINQCADPIEVTFMITNERPHVDFKYTFKSADTLVSVPRFTVETQLRVRLAMKKDDVINIEADFYVYGQGRADFINDDIKLRGLEDHCPALNTAAKIAIGVMGALAVLAAILILVLMYIRYRRKRRRETRNQLVSNVAEPGFSTPVASVANLNEDQVTSVDSTNSDTVNARTISDTRFTDRHSESMFTDGLNATRFKDTNSDTRFTDRNSNTRFTDGHSDSGFTDGHRDTRFTDGHSDSEFTDGHRDTRFTDGPSDSGFTDGHRDTRFTDGHSDTGFTDGHSDTRYTDGHSDTRFKDGHSDTRFTDGHSDTRFTDGHSDTQHSRSSAQNDDDLDVRYSDIIRRENLKISDC